MNVPLHKLLENKGPVQHFFSFIKPDVHEKLIFESVCTHLFIGISKSAI